MYVIPDIVELKLYGVGDRGIANKERVILRAWEHGPVDLAQFFVTAGWKFGGGAAPVADTLCWLGEHQIAARQWLFVYTGPGARRSSETEKGEHLYVVHWNSPKTLFTVPESTPVLIRAGGIAVTRSPDYVMNPAQLPLGLSDVQTPRSALADLASRIEPPKK